MKLPSTLLLCVYTTTNYYWVPYYLYCTTYMYYYYYPVLVENGVPNNLPLALVENVFLWPDL